MTARAYLDHNAGAPIRPAARAALLAALDAGGNASSVHAEGRSARNRIERARDAVAALADARPDGVVFTSGGTEANATALRLGALVVRDGRPVERLVTVATEHPSVLGGHGFPLDSVTVVGVDASGRVDLDSLRNALGASDRPSLVSVQAANSETGVLQPLDAIVALCRAGGHAVHSDAVQAAGRLPVGLGHSGLDALTLSGHKLGAPSGIGALVVAPGRAGPAFRLLAGGPQENGWRAGTENLAGIAAFGAAAGEALAGLATEPDRLSVLRDEAERAVLTRAPHAIVFGAGSDRAPGTLAFAVPGLAAETALAAFDLDGVAVSSGSACSSGKVGRSHVLAAMGIAPDLARGALRVSFGWNSTRADLARFVAAFDSLIGRLYGRERTFAA